MIGKSMERITYSEELDAKTTKDLDNFNSLSLTIPHFDRA